VVDDQWQNMVEDRKSTILTRHGRHPFTNCLWKLSKIRHAMAAPWPPFNNTEQTDPSVKKKTGDNNNHSITLEISALMGYTRATFVGLKIKGYR